MKREWLAVGVAALIAGLAAGGVVYRRWRAASSFERAVADLRASATPQSVVAAALRLPRDRFLIPVIAKALGEPGVPRLLASTAVEYWDRCERNDGLWPRPEHRARPIRELLPLLPVIARAQEEDETTDACLVSVWDRSTLLNCADPPRSVPYLPPNTVWMGPSKRHPKRDAQTLSTPMHRELLGVLLDRDPRPVTKDGFAGLVYAYATDQDLVAAVDSLCASPSR